MRTTTRNTKVTFTKVALVALAVLMALSMTFSNTFTVHAKGCKTSSTTYTINDYGAISAVKDGRYIYYTGTYQNFMRYDTITKELTEIAELQSIPEGNGHWTNGGSNLVKHGGYFYFVWDAASGVESDYYIFRVTSDGEMTKLAKGSKFVIKNNKIYYTKMKHLCDSDFGNEKSVGTYSMNLDGSNKKAEPKIRLITTRCTNIKSKYGTLMGKNYSLEGDYRTAQKLIFNDKSGKTRTVMKTHKYNYILTFSNVGDYIVYAYHSGPDSNRRRTLVFEKYDGTEKQTFDIGSPAARF